MLDCLPINSSPIFVVADTVKTKVWRTVLFVGKKTLVKSCSVFQINVQGKWIFLEDWPN